MSTPEEYIKEKLSTFEGVMPYDDFTNLATSVAHVHDIPLKEATELIHKLRGKLEIGSQEFQNQGFGKNNLWDGQDRALNFGQNAPGDLAEPKASLGPLSKLELFSYKKGDIVRVVNNDQAPWGGEYKGVIERINAQNTFDIRDIATGVLNVNQPAHLLRNPLGEGRQDVRVQQKRVGDPKGMGEGQSDSGDPNTKREMPGMYHMPRGQEGKDIKNPQSLFYKEAGSFGHKIGDKVTVRKDQYSPDTWINCHCGKYMQMVKPGHPGQFYYKGIEGRSGTILAKYGSSHEKSGFSFDCYTVLIDDVGTYHLNDMNLDHAQPQMKIKLKEEPSKDKLDSLKDKIKAAETSGNKELAKQLMEQYMSLTASQDPLYAFLLGNIVKEYGEASAEEVKQYLEGKISSPSKSLTSILRKHNIVATAEKSMLNVKKALEEVRGKTVEQINTETAWTWGSRAAACYQLSSEASSEEEKDKWSSLGDDYRHESLEHAALVEDEGKLVGEVSRAIAPFKKGNSHEGTVR